MFKITRFLLVVLAFYHVLVINCNAIKKTEIERPFESLNNLKAEETADYESLQVRSAPAADKNESIKYVSF